MTKKSFLGGGDDISCRVLSVLDFSIKVLNIGQIAKKLMFRVGSDPKVIMITCFFLSTRIDQFFSTLGD